MKAILACLLAALLPGSLAAQHHSAQHHPAQHHPEWTVVTLALDGSWGVGTSEYYGPALASALRKCEATSVGQSDCGADVTAVRKGWTLGILCGEHRVLVAATDLTTAILDAQARQMFLRELYGDGMPSCSCVMWVDPRGLAATSRKPPGANRTVLGR